MKAHQSHFKDQFAGPRASQEAAQRRAYAKAGVKRKPRPIEPERGA